LWLNIANCGIYSLAEINFKFPELNILDTRNNELLTENDLEPLKELEQLVDLSIGGNPLCKKVEYF
jgi:Leucine-rich repeat (LRR) protein